jgi:hypothetical protein
MFDLKALGKREGMFEACAELKEPESSEDCIMWC